MKRKKMKFRNRFVLFEETITNNISEAELNCFHNVVDKIKEIKK